jgi:hypothetical protein
MNRLPLVLAAIAAAVAVAACGSADAGNGSSSASPSGGAFARGADGQLVQISGNTLTLSSTSGIDTTVTYTASTVITKTSTGTVADVVPGVCITATGAKDATGAITAATVSVSSPVNGSCSAGFGFGGGGGARRSPSPGFTPNPAFANRAAVRGLVSAVNGTQVTVKTSTGAATTFTIPTTVRVTTTATATPSELTTGECIAAAGSRESSGTVSARSLIIVPAGPSGCFSGGAGGFGGFGGGGFFGGGGGGGAFGGGGGSAVPAAAQSGVGTATT